MQEIKCCRACAKRNLQPFFDLGCQPFANSLLPARLTAETVYPLSMSLCPDCSLVQLNQTADPKELFSQYVWMTSTSSTAREYAQKFSNSVLGHAVDIDPASYILELASNDGTFLKPFHEKGFRVLGVDPAENIAKMAIAEGIPTICGFFDRSMAEDIVRQQRFPGVIIVRNVLPHVANLHGFVGGIRKCMDVNTLLVIEVHYVKSILEELHYDSIYHEHLCYFSLKSLEQLIGSYGLHIYDIMASPISGGSVVVFARLSQCEKSEKLLEYEKQEDICGINELAYWKRFAETGHEHRTAFVALLDSALARGCEIVGYGASARSSTLLNFCNIGAERIKVIADQNTMKHERFTPGTHIPIENPATVMASNPDTVVVLAWNFLEEIAETLWSRFNFRNTLLVPFPHPPKSLTIGEVVNG